MLLGAVLTGSIAGGPLGCKNDSPDYFVRPFDGGDDGGDGAAPDEVDPTLGGPCTEDAQCDDALACTADHCDLAILRCRNVPDDSQCDDGIYCNGRELCVPKRGCEAGGVVTCQDGDPCTIDTCIEAARDCTRVLRDVDGDGVPDDHCVGGSDCDDTDPAVSSQRTEICGNGRDDDCDGQLDETPCSAPANDVCATAQAAVVPGTTLLTTVAASKDYATTCSVANPAAGQDVVAVVTVPGTPSDGPRDVRVWARAASSANEVAVALETACGASSSEVACGHVAAASGARAIARGVTPGDVLYAVVTTQAEGAVDLEVEVLPATPKPTNESCASPLAVATDVPIPVSLVDPAKDLASACAGAKTGELSYVFTLSQPSDVRIFASTVEGAGVPVVTLRDDTCTGELRCRASTTPPLFARNLAAGPHVFTVAGTSQIDASVLVRTYPPTVAPPTQSCATAPAITPNAAIAVDLSNHEDAFPEPCLGGGIGAAYTLDLPVASDVLAVARFPQGATGGVSIEGPACTNAQRLVCRTGTTPVRASRRNLPAGSYRVIVADLGGEAAELTVFVRPTVAPVTLTGQTADSCVAPAIIPPEGGFFTGDTSSAQAEIGAGCDAPGLPLGGAKDRLLKIDLPTQKRIVLEMGGSTYTTLLDLRSGSSCPGLEVPDACHVGFGGARSFLERVVPAGTYYVQVDGYGGQTGTFDLDVRVLPP